MHSGDEPDYDLYWSGSTNQKRLTAAVTATLVVNTILVAGRLYQRKRRGRKLGKDDWALLAAFFALVGYTTAVVTAIKHGLGYPIDQLEDAATYVIQAALIASFFFTMIAEGLATMAYAFFVSQMTANAGHRYITYGLAAVAAVCTLGGIVACAVPAASNRALSYAAWETFGTIEAFVFVCLYVLILRLLWTSRMSLASRTFATAWYLPALILPAYMGVRLGHTPYYFFGEYYDGKTNDFTYELVSFVILLTVEVNLIVAVAASGAFLDVLPKAADEMRSLGSVVDLVDGKGGAQTELDEV